MFQEDSRFAGVRIKDLGPSQGSRCGEPYLKETKKLMTEKADLERNKREVFGVQQERGRDERVRSVSLVER